MFDAVACQFGVMFYPDKVQGHKEAYRVLKPGGHYFFNVWDRLETSDFTQVVTGALEEMFPDDPPRFTQHRKVIGIRRRYAMNCRPQVSGRSPSNRWRRPAAQIRRAMPRSPFARERRCETRSKLARHPVSRPSQNMWHRPWRNGLEAAPSRAVSAPTLSPLCARTALLEKFVLGRVELQVRPSWREYQRATTG